MTTPFHLSRVHMLNRYMIGAFALLGVLASTNAVIAQGYHVVKEIPIGGAASWDYLAIDSANRRLFVSRTHRIYISFAKYGPPPPPDSTAAPGGRGRGAPAIPNSFAVLVLEPNR